MLLTHRLHVLLDDDRWHRLEVEAGRRGVAMAVLVREAIDATFPAADDDERRRAFEDIASAVPMALPGPAELRRELDELRGRGL